jgi:uncharacterized OB-fold protein
MSYGTSSSAPKGPAGAARTSGYNKPLPEITPLTKGFWDNAKQHRLAMQVCTKCGDVHFPASPVCPKCLSEAQEWRPVSGRGTLESWVEFHHAYWPGFADEMPYRVCLVKLDEGPLLVSNLVGEEPAIGSAIEVVFEDVTDEVTLPKFQSAK